MKHVLIAAALASFVLSACQSQVSPILPQGQNQLSQQRPVLASALLKRSLQLQRVNGQMQPVAAVHAPASAGFGILQVSAISVAKPAIAPVGMYYYGGGEFNQYSIQYAEENIYPKPQGNSLLEVYNKTVMPILGEWDRSARLVESRAVINGSDFEYIHLPGKEGEPLQVKPKYVFRFASSPKKETLHVYVLDGETRVHRMVWGEPSIDMAKVKVDSDEALTIAKKAFNDRNSKPGYPVYPEQVEQNATVIYDLPEKLAWQLHLNQQSKDQLRYYLSFSYQGEQTGAVKCEGPNVRCAMPYPGGEYYYGSIEIDAITGEIKNLNRPVKYNQQFYPMPVPMPGEKPVAEPASSGGASPGDEDVASSSDASSAQ